MNNYIIEKPKDAPDWFTPGIQCRVRNHVDDPWQELVTVVWYNVHDTYRYIDNYGKSWKYAEPIKIERWVPGPNDQVFWFYEGCADPPVLDTFSTVLKEDARSDEPIVYRITDDVCNALKSSSLTIKWLKEHGERWEG